MVVVFPAPLGPRNPKLVPRGILSDRSSTAIFWPYSLLTPSNWIAQSLVAMSLNPLTCSKCCIERRVKDLLNLPGFKGACGCPYRMRELITQRIDLSSACLFLTAFSYKHAKPLPCHNNPCSLEMFIRSTDGIRIDVKLLCESSLRGEHLAGLVDSGSDRRLNLLDDLVVDGSAISAVDLHGVASSLIH